MLGHFGYELGPAFPTGTSGPALEMFGLGLHVPLYNDRVEVMKNIIQSE